MRGKLPSIICGSASTRITPADAGKTLKRRLKLGVFGDHPRGCGENVRPYIKPRQPRGSPPRMRGKPLFSALGGNNSRITPADAGKTVDKEQALVVGQDHPRGCGENAHRRQLPLQGRGSPPRMRGKLICVMPCSTVDRITPADAGKTPLIVDI